LAHTLTGTATRPMSCTSAARRSVTTSEGARPATPAAIIRGRAAISSPKNRASISLSAVHPAKCSRPV
jgi:hypothetical protein